MNVQTAAARLGMPAKTVRKMMKDGRLPIGYVDQDGGRTTFYIIEPWLNRFLENGPVAGKEEK